MEIGSTRSFNAIPANCIAIMLCILLTIVNFSIRVANFTYMHTHLHIL